MQVFGLRRAGLILAGVLVIGLAITVAGRARRPRVVVFEGSVEPGSVPGQVASAFPMQARVTQDVGQEAGSGRGSEELAPAGAPDQSVARAEPAPVARPAIVVHVAGAVAKPGVYSLDAGARVDDALNAAGGALKAADTDCINLALPVRDGEQVYVPLGQADVGGQQQPRQSAVSIVPPNRADITRSAPDPGSSADPARASASGKASHAGLININTASAEELQGLPGVGPVLAQRIIDYRSANGPFATVDGLVGVSGIGQATLSKIAPMATVR
jgi:competence protein ComEA